MQKSKPHLKSQNHRASNIFFGFMVLAFSFSFLPLSLSEAQAQTSVSIEPALIEDNFDPGDSLDVTLRVTNNTGNDNEFYLLARDIKELAPNGRPIFAEVGEDTPHSLREWLNLPQEPVFIPNGESREVAFSVQIPTDASPGGHFGSVFVSRQGELPDRNATAVGYEVGTLMNFKISGNIVEDAILREFSTDKNIYSEPNIIFTSKVENKGNVLIRPIGPLEVTNIFGKKVATLRVNESNNGVFPGQEKVFTTAWNPDEMLFGRYQALVGFVYGDEVRKNVSSSVTFWVLPMNIIAPVVGGLLIIIVGAYLLIRFFIQRKVKALGLAVGGNAGRKSAGVDTRISSRHAAPISKLALISLSLLMLALLFLLVLFFLFG